MVIMLKYILHHIKIKILNMTEQLSQQQRDDYIEESKRQALEVLQIPQVQQRLGVYASELYSLANSVQSVKVDNGIVHSHEVHPRLVPATVIRVGEKVTRLSAQDMFDEHQLETIRSNYGDTYTENIIEKYRSAVASGGSGVLPSFNEQFGYAHSNAQLLDEGGEVVRGRPMLVMNWDSTDRQHSDAPVLLHELIHVYQNRRYPIWNPEIIDFNAQRLTRELEGYAVSAMIILGIQDAGRQHEFLTSTPQPSQDIMLEIEAIRARANRYETDPYAATRQVGEELIAGRYGITSFLVGKILNK